MLTEFISAKKEFEEEVAKTLKANVKKLQLARDM